MADNAYLCDNMNEKELKSYRFSSGEDPTDEMLDQLMANAAKQAKERSQATQQRFFDNLARQCREIKVRKQS